MAVFLCFASTALAVDSKSEGLKKVFMANSYATEIIDLRSSLAKGFIKPGVEITEDTFKGVCGEVAKRVKEISEKEGIIIRHAAKRYRNPKNAATPEEEALIARFASNKGLSEVQEDIKKDGKAYLRYTKPVYVEEACLACHGQKEKRPAFILEKYPDDRAYGFNNGDLRGIISVLVPR
jgi:hypothetical protein